MHLELGPHSKITGLYPLGARVFFVQSLHVLCVFSLGSPNSYHSPKTCISGRAELADSNCPFVFACLVVYVGSANDLATHPGPCIAGSFWLVPTTSELEG